jgi:hypothetical protein
MGKWTKQTYKLKPGHGWRARPGFKVFVADRGALRFDYPEDWICEPDSESIKFYDRPPPDDDCILQVSLLRLSPDVDWRGLPLTTLLRDAVGRPGDDSRLAGEIVHITRPDLEYAWCETWRLDPRERRDACCRTCLARGRHDLPLITLDFWPEDGARLEPVWDELLRSLQLEQYVEDPTHRRFL